MPRRKAGALLPLEFEILSVGLELQARDGDFYGFLLAKEMRSDDPATPLLAHGTLYKALGRLTESGLLESSWEDPGTAEAEGRPRRRLYRLSGEGELAQARGEGARRTAASSPAAAQVSPA